MYLGSIITLLFLSFVVSQIVEFNAVYPVNEKFVSMQIEIVQSNHDTKGQTFIMKTNATDLITHKYIYNHKNTTIPINELKYHFIVNETKQSNEEDFWRNLDECQLISSTNKTLKTKNLYFGQNETLIGLSNLPYLTNKTINPPFYFDDNQVITVSLQISEIDLKNILFNPNDEGKTYVPGNLTLISLNKKDYYTNMKIRRAGGDSLDKIPYSYQMKFDQDIYEDILKEVIIKLKGYGDDYYHNGANIIAEKTASDICMVVGAPINFVSYARVIINGEFQGIYGMLEKVDDSFVERRWPFISRNNSDFIGSLYKIQQANWFLLTSNGWNLNARDFCQQEALYYSSCCNCYENNCDVDDDCDFNKENEICQKLSCCTSCSWESNEIVDIETANCNSQYPFQDLLTLGNSMQVNNFEDILNIDGYLSSLICSLVVMNSDGYVFHGKNYVS